MRVLVLGAGGMAGHVVATHLSERGHEVATLSARHKLNDHTVLMDVTDTLGLERHLSAGHYDVVVNCVGLLVEPSEERKDLAVYINSYLPHFLEDFYGSTVTKVIHLSTDCVFSGLNAPYIESAPYDGTRFYDRSKALGEVVNDKDLTLRMSIIGPDMRAEGTGLLNWFLTRTGPVNGYTGSIWNGITTIELSKGIDQAINEDIRGLYHLAPAQSISKFDLLRLIGEVFGRTEIAVTPIEGIVHNKTLVNTRTDFSFVPQSYSDMIAEMREWILRHKELYRHYA